MGPPSATAHLGSVLGFTIQPSTTRPPQVVGKLHDRRGRADYLVHDVVGERGGERIALVRQLDGRECLIAGLVGLAAGGIAGLVGLGLTAAPRVLMVVVTMLGRIATK